MEKEEKQQHEQRINVKLVTIISFVIFIFYYYLHSSVATTLDKPSIVFAGVSKGIKPEQINAIVSKLSHLGDEIASEYYFVIYDNDSTDQQKATWENALMGRGLFVSEPTPQSWRRMPRTERMAAARNRMMDLIQPFNHDYLWIQDLDGVCGGPNGSATYSVDVFREIFKRDNEWDVVSFIYVPYWDLWAFRHPTMFPYNMYGRKARSNPPRASVSRILEQYLEMPVVDRPLLEVASAFMMTAIHKMWAVRHSRYNHKDTNGDNDCEHVAFYRDAKSRGARIRLWPVAFCEGDPGFVRFDPERQ